MGSKTTTTRDYKVFDPYSQLGIGDAQKKALGQQGVGATQAGLTQYQNWATGNLGDYFGNLMGSLGGVFGGMGGGGGGGGGRGGGGGGGGGLEAMRWFELGPEAMALKNDPYQDEYIARQRENELSRFGTGIAAQQAAQGRQALDMARRAGIDPSSPAFLRSMGNLQSQSAALGARGKRDIASDLLKQTTEAKLENLRQLAGMETQGGLGNLQASASDRGSARSLMGQRAMANASRYAANQALAGQRLGFLGDMARMGFGASQNLGMGGALQGLGQPYSINVASETTRQSPGIGGILGGIFGGLGSVVGMGGLTGLPGAIWGGRRV